MYRNIIVGYDGTDESEDALALACRLAALEHGRLTLAFAYAGRSIPVQIGSAAIGVKMSDEAQAVLDRALNHIPAGMRATTRKLADPSPARALHMLAEHEHADLVVLGSTALGAVGRVTVGSIGTRLLHGLPCAVAVAPHGFAKDEPPEIERIGICWDGSPEAELALSAAIELAQASNAELRVLTAIDRVPVPFPSYPAPDVPDYMLDDVLDAAMDLIPEGVCAGGQRLHGKPAMALSRQAQTEKLDILVSGSRGYGPVGRVLLGGVSSKLMRMAPCPVIVVPRSAARRASEAEPVLTSTAAKPEEVHR
jgi:nucleotide-binding universal stress UspA family protein